MSDAASPVMTQPLTDRLAVAVLVDRGQEIGRQIARGVSRFADVHGTGWVCQVPPALRASALEPLGRCHALVAAVTRPDYDDFIRQFPGPKVICQPSTEAVLTVLPDDERIGEMAAEHLLACGLRHFGFYDVLDSITTRRRGNGFFRCLTDSGYEVDRFDRAPLHLLDEPPRLSSVAAGLGNQWLDSRLTAWIESLSTPAGVFVARDSLAAPLFAACRSVGRQIPDEIAVIAADNDELACANLSPPLSTIDPGYWRVGFEAAARLHDWLTGRATPTFSRFIEPLCVVARQSSDVLAAADEDVRQALQMIREHACHGLSAQEVYRAVPRGKRSLEASFTRLLGRSVRDELDRVRLERAKELLSQSEWTIAQIADACGYGQPPSFTRWFRDAIGKTPTAYRQRFRPDLPQTEA